MLLVLTITIFSGLESNISLQIKNESRYLTLNGQLRKICLRKTEQLTFLKIGVYSYNFNRNEIYDSNIKKRGLFQREIVVTVHSMCCRRLIDVKYFTGPHNNHIPRTRVKYFLTDKNESRYLTLRGQLRQICLRKTE